MLASFNKRDWYSNNAKHKRKNVAECPADRNVHARMLRSRNRFRKGNNFPTLSKIATADLLGACRVTAGESSMIRFQIGDEVRVTGLPNSEDQGSAGLVVKTYRRSDDENGEVQVCSVQFRSGRRWFLASHLTIAAPDRARRFFRGEALYRWGDLSPDDVLFLNGNREELIAFLQERYGFSLKRATSEADSFISDIGNRIHSAAETSSESLSAAPAHLLKISA